MKFNLGISCKVLWLFIGLALMAGLVMMPSPEGLSIAGQRVVAVLCFALVVWISEAVSYPYSGVAIIFFLIVLLGFAPAGNGAVIGTAKAMSIALSGFVNAGWVLGTAGLFMAAGMLTTGMEKRIALNILNIVGVRTNAIFAGTMAIMLVLDFFIPAVTARSATMTPIAVGLIAAFGVDKRSVFARMLLVTVAISSSISGIGLLSASPPNAIAQAFIQSTLHASISWGDWLIYAMPYCIALMAVLYFLVTRMNRFEFAEIPGGKTAIARALAELGPMSGREKRISLIFFVTILFWATESYHRIDVNTVAVMSVVLMLAPVIGIAGWDDLSSLVDWGTVLLFGAGISLGSALLESGAALWLANSALGGIGLNSMPPAAILLIIVVALIIIRFAFASITSATAALVPTVLGFLVSLGNASLPVFGMTLISTFTLYFSFILPANSPQAVIAYSTNTFDVKDMARIGIPLTVCAVGLLIIFFFTYWHWLGLV